MRSGSDGVTALLSVALLLPGLTPGAAPALPAGLSDPELAERAEAEFAEGVRLREAADKARQEAIAAGKSQADQDTAGQTAFEQAVRVCAQRIAAQYPSLGVPALNNPVFYDQVLLEPDGRHVRPFWTWAMPDPQHAVITARLDPNASLAERSGL